MIKEFCEVCGKEVKAKGRLFHGTLGKLNFSISADVDNNAESTPCLPCLIKAINKEASRILKRKYVRKQKVEEIKC